MAMIKCRECGNDVSSKARRCPHCGGKIKRPVGPITATIIIGLAVLMVIAHVNAPPHDPAADQRLATAQRLDKRLKAVLHDPKSLAYQVMLVDERGTYACARYRAANAFGGMSLEHVVLNAAGGLDQSDEAWNTLCTSQMYDLTTYFR